MYKNLVFKGGGIKIYASIGALEALYQFGSMEHIERVAGSSAGALMALLASLNMPIEEIKDFVFNIDLLEEAKNTHVRDKTIRFFNEFGLYTGQPLARSMYNLLKEKTGNGDITFMEFHELGFKDLYITGTNISKSFLQVFSYEDSPNVKIVDAVVVSGSYPMYFAPKIIDNDFYLDGGLMDNYPVNIFDSPKYMPSYCNNSGYNPETLGIFLGSTEGGGAIIQTMPDLMNMVSPFNDMDPTILQEEINKLNFDDLFARYSEKMHNVIQVLSNALLISSNNYIVPHFHEQRDIKINIDPNIGALDFYLTPQQIQDLVTVGYEDTKAYIEHHSDRFFNDFDSCLATDSLLVQA